MLWRVRTTLADRPGALAALARRCGEEQVNILGLQIFPGVEGVTDELVLRAPSSWSAGTVAELVEAAGGGQVSVAACTEHALADGPTRYLHAARTVTDHPGSASQVLAGLLGCDPAADLRTAWPTAVAPGPDTLEVDVAGERIRLQRTAPFTAAEHARATAFAELVERMCAPRATGPVPSTSEPGQPVSIREGRPGDAAGLIQMHGRCSTESVYRHYAAPMTRPDPRLARRLLTGGAGAVVATDHGVVVGFASLGEVVDGACELSLLVEDGRQRQGIGTRLLAAATRRAAAAGAEDVVLRGPAESQAAVAMVFGSGLRARIKLQGDQLVVTISTRGLAAVVGGGIAPDRRYDGAQPPPAPGRSRWTSTPPVSPTSSQPSV